METKTLSHSCCVDGLVYSDTKGAWWVTFSNNYRLSLEGFPIGKAMEPRVRAAVYDAILRRGKEERFIVNVKQWKRKEKMEKDSGKDWEPRQVDESDVENGLTLTQHAAPALSAIQYACVCLCV